MVDNIKLGDKVRCKITGFTGIATSRTEFINGCIQIEVTPKMKKGEKLSVDNITGMGIDKGSLEKVNDGINKKDPIEKKRTGGANRLTFKRRNF